jgi:hypothetical protein
MRLPWKNLGGCHNLGHYSYSQVNNRQAPVTTEIRAQWLKHLSEHSALRYNALNADLTKTQ